MGKNLNIKSDEAHDLATQLARATGESISTAVTKAIRERLRKVKDPSEKAAEIMAIGRDCASRWKEPWKSSSIDELLYDAETGLPK